MIERSAEAPKVRVLYGSETGNAEGVARDLAQAARARGIEATVAMLDDATPEELAGAGCLLVVAATTGEGDMPYNADRFWCAVTEETAARMDGVPFAVLGLGDTGYFDFCQAAIDLDNRFAELGGRRLREVVKCDVDFEDDAAAWTGEMLELLTPKPEPVAVGSGSGSRRHEPKAATVLANRPLSGPGALKEVRHLELCLADTGLSYRPGDSLGILPGNDPVLVARLIAQVGGAAGEDVDGRPLHQVLGTDYEISRPSRELVEEVARRTEDAELRGLLAGGDRAALHEFLWARDVLDLLKLATRPPLTSVELLELLRPLARRSYSIASSPLLSPERVELAVATIRYRVHGRDRGGVCSTHVADRISRGDVATVVLEPNENFRPPADGDRSMIMVGPGTGVAPFRGFLYERRASGARGGNWLFFGGRHRRCDLLYGDELLAMADDGHLDRLDLAFSRDQPAKVYVQDRMREQGRTLYQWLADGAHFYVCGDAERMAGDVDAALHEIVAEHGGMSEDKAVDFVNDLKREHRYVRDVY